MKLGSLFDGIGGFPYVAQMCGITPVWASEVEPFPIAVTNHHFPDMKHLGDITKINGAEIEPVDIITFGSPCQDLSIAGQRKGMKHENHGDDETTRSGLFMEAIRIIKEMREKTNGVYPTFAVWENVPGAFSSNKGEDFRAVIEEFCKIKDGNTIIPKPPKNKWARAGAVLGNGYSVAWRTLDAQYWGVPQRRKRIYLVADFGGERAGEILFESEGVSGYSPQDFRAWKGTAGDTESGIGAAGTVCLNDHGGERTDVTEDMTCTLRAKSNHPPCVLVPAAIMFENHSQDTRYTGPLATAPTVSSTYGTGGNNQPLVLETPKMLKIRSGCEGGRKGTLIQDDLSATLGCNNDQTLFVLRSPDGGLRVHEDISPTLNTAQGEQRQPCVVENNVGYEQRAYDEYLDTGIGTTLKSAGGSLGGGSENVVYCVNESQLNQFVRRLTPTECARLQGYPDYWHVLPKVKELSKEKLELLTQAYILNRHIKTNKPLDEINEPTEKSLINWYNKLDSDSAVYKAYGNSLALPCAYTVIAGISKYRK